MRSTIVKIRVRKRPAPYGRLVLAVEEINHPRWVSDGVTEDGDVGVPNAIDVFI